MKAAICTKYGAPEVIRIEEVEKPVPKENEILIKVITATVHIGDTKVRRLEPGAGPAADFFYRFMMRLVVGFNAPRKKILGMELAGLVEKTGRDVKRFKTGDKVFASTEFNFGAHSEYICIRENGIVAHMPDYMSFEEAAPVSNAGLTVLYNLRKGNIKKGDKVLIYGASGSLGTYAVQMAKYFGAVVTGVCSTGNLEMVKSLGADYVIDYTKEDFTLSGIKYDFIFDTVGKIPQSKRKTALTGNGIFLSALSLSSAIKLKLEDLLALKELCEKARLKTVIDRIYPFDEIAEAHRYVDKGHKKGNVVITVSRI